MPTPLGHALAGIAAGALSDSREAWAVERSWLSRLPAACRRPAVFAALAVAPDLDLLVGRHSTYTHSVGAALAVAALAWWLSRRARTTLACTLAYASHILLDWLGDDTSPPIGIMALWPFTSAFYQSDLHLFMAVDRRYWLPSFWRHDSIAIMWEALLLGPLAAAGVWRIGDRGSGIRDRGLASGVARKPEA